MNESHYMFVYWIVGAFFDDIETLTLAIGLLRSFESVGSCVSFGVGAAQVSPMVNLILAFVMFGITIPATSAVVFLVPEHPVNARADSDEDVVSVGGTSADEKVHHDPAVVTKVVSAVDGQRAI